MPIGQQMSIGQMLQSANPLAVYEAQSNYQKAQGKQNKTDRFAEGNYSALGGIGMAAKLLGGYLSGKHGKATDSAQADLIKAQFADFQEQSAMAEKRKAEAQAEKYRRADAISKQDHLNAMELKASGQQGTSLMQNAMAAGIDLKSPEGQQFIKQHMGKSNGTVINNNMPSTKGQTKWDEEFAKSNVELYKDARNKAYLASQTQNTLNQIKPMLDSMNTGLTDDWMATAGKIFKTQGAINKESVDSLVGSLVMDELNKMAGSAQIEERKYIAKLQASYDKTPEANARIIQYLTDKNTDTMNNFNEVESYRKQHGNLTNYTPSFNSVTQQPQQKPENKPNQFQNMSNEDLLRALENGN